MRIPFLYKRRELLKSTAALATTSATAFCMTPTLANNRSNYGIEGAAAPELKIDYWIDANGDPADFSITASRGKWIFLKCFQNWCPGCHSSGFPTLQKFSTEFASHPKVAIAGIQTVFEGFTSNYA